MDHTQVLQLGAVEKYLLNELPPDVRDEFEEHFFDCSDCATDLKATAAFMDAARKELGFQKAARKPATPIHARQAQMGGRWRSMLIAGALAASLLVLLYQNVVVYPHYKGEIAQLQTAEILPAISLVGTNSRGGAATPRAVVRQGRPFLMQLDLPTQNRFTSYTCKLYSPSGSVIWQVLVSSERARDTVTISGPAQDNTSGTYTLAVHGNTDGSVESGTTLATYGFHLDMQP